MSRRPLALLVTGLALLAPLAACSDDDGEGPAAERTTSTTAAPAPSAGGGDPAEDPAAEEPTQTTLGEGVEELVLRGDGLGLVTFGDDPDAAVAAVSAVLGPPTGDGGWEPAPTSAYGTCPGEQIRGVEWDHLTLLFTDGETEHGSGPHLFAWRLSGAPPALGTAAGFGWQATAADAEELHPGAVERVPPEGPFPGFLDIEVEGGRLTAWIDTQDVVTNLEAGAACGE